MKKTLIKLLTTLMAMTLILSGTAVADGFDSVSTIDAYWALVGKNNTAEATAQNALLTRVMDGEFNTADQTALAAAFADLSKLTNDDLALFAGQAKIPVAMVRHNYYIALTNALSAEIAVNPAAAGDERNLQIIFSLFLDVAGEDTDAAERERRALRKQIKQEEIASFAQMYGVPTAFLEFIIMSDDWDDTEWEDDEDWAEDMGWNLDNWADNGDVRRLLGDEAVVSYDTVYKALLKSGYTFRDGDSMYGQTDYGITDYGNTDYGFGSDGETDYGQTDYGKTDYDGKDTDYGVTDYGKSDYGNTDYDGKDTDYGVTDYGKSDYGNTDYDDPNTDYGNTDYGKTDYGKSDYDKSDYGDTDYD